MVEAGIRSQSYEGNEGMNVLMMEVGETLRFDNCIGNGALVQLGSTIFPEVLFFFLFLHLLSTCSSFLPWPCIFIYFSPVVGTWGVVIVRLLKHLLVHLPPRLLFHTSWLILRRILCTFLLMQY